MQIVKFSPRFLGGKESHFGKILLNKDEETIWRNLLNKDRKTFLSFWFLVDKKYFKMRNFHREEQRKKLFWKSGQGSFSKIIFFHKKCKKFPKILATRIKNFGFFYEKFRKFLQNLKSRQHWRMRKYFLWKINLFYSTRY